MKTILIFILVLVMAQVGLVNAAQLNLKNNQDHGSWSSFKLSLGEYRFYRAINVVDYTDFRVMVDFEPDECVPEFEIQFEFSESFAETENLGFRDVAIRVDRKPIQEGLMNLSTEAGNDVLFIEVYAPEMQRLISEMRLGETLRLKFSLYGDDSDPTFAELSLLGSRAALDRARALCLKDKDGPESYFDDEGAQPSGEAADYF